MLPFCGLGTVQLKVPVLGAEEAMVPQKGLRFHGRQGERRSRENPHEVLSQSWRVMLWKAGLGVHWIVKVLPGRRMSLRMGWRKRCVRGEVAFEVGIWAVVRRARAVRMMVRQVRSMVDG